MPLRTILTVGHSTHELDAFLALVRGAEVETVADVRRFPGSRRMPWFNREALEDTLGDGYLHLPELGGRRSRHGGDANAAWRVPAFQGYADHMQSPEFAQGLARLEAEAARRCTAVMCAEANWWQCHRRLIADALLVRNWNVEHLAPDGRRVLHELPAFAQVEGTRVSYPALSLM